MIQVQLQSVSVQNVGPIKDITIPILSGTTLIRGHNQDAKTGGRQTNAVGKSLSISPIALGFTSSRPMLAPKRYQRSGAFQTAGACTSLELKVNDVPYTLINRQKGSSFELQINRKGKDLKYRTLKIAEAARQQLLPMTEEQFYSTVYLDMKRPSVIQAGTDAQRLDFLCRLFDLNQLDVYRKRLLAKQQELLSKRQEQKTLAQELMDVEQRLKTISWGPRAESRYQTLKNEQQQVTDELAALAQKVDQSAEGREQRKARAEARKQLLDGPQPKISDLKEQLKVAKRIEGEQQLFDGMQRQKRKMERLLGQKLPKCPKETVEELEKQLALMRRHYQPVIVNKERPRPEGKLLDQAAYTKHTALSMLNEQELATDCCPTCGHKIGDLGKKVKQAKKLIKLHHKILLWNQYEKERREAAALQQKMEELVEKGKVVATKLNLARKHQAQSGLRDAIRKIEKEFKNRPKLKGPTSNQLRKQIQQVRQHVAAKKILDTPLIPMWPKALKEHETATKRLTEIGNHLSELHSRRIEHRTLIKSKKLLTSKLNSFGDLESDERALTQLLKLLSNKGLKVEAANAVLHELERRMNDHAQLLFVEPVRFKFNATPGKVSLLYQHTKADKRRQHLWVDIRELSGQESRAFSLLFFCSVRPLLPTIQTDFVVLDEMDSNMSQPTRDLFAKEFLPYLQTLIPKIIIATPDSNTAYSGRVVNLVKKNGVTRLATPIAGVTNSGSTSNTLQIKNHSVDFDDPGIKLAVGKQTKHKLKTVIPKSANKVSTIKPSRLKKTTNHNSKKKK